MSDRIWIICNECNDRKVIAKRFSVVPGWVFRCYPKEGIPIINADSKQELESQLEIGGLNPNQRETLVMVAAFNEWLEEHKSCKDFSLDVEV